MADQSLLDLISRQLAAGESVEKIQQSLVAKGYPAEDINGAFAYVRLHQGVPVAGEFPQRPPEMPQKGNRVLFSVALIILLLGVASISFVLYAQTTDAASLERVRAMIVERQNAFIEMVYPSHTAPAPVAPVVHPTAQIPIATTSTTTTTKTTTKTAVPTKTPTAVQPKPVYVPPAPVVQAPQPVPSVSLNANAKSVAAGTPLTLTWSSTDATSCDGIGFFSNGLTSGSATVVANSSYDFKVTCMNASHSATDDVSVTVTAS